MTNQEEIEERMVELCREQTTGAGKQLAGRILDYLHSQGVVIKVEGMLPTCPCECCKHEDIKAGDDFCFEREDCGEDYKKWELAGYVSVEPLIEE